MSTTMTAERAPSRERTGGRGAASYGSAWDVAGRDRRVRRGRAAGSAATAAARVAAPARLPARSSRTGVASPRVGTPPIPGRPVRACSLDGASLAAGASTSGSAGAGRVVEVRSTAGALVLTRRGRVLALAVLMLLLSTTALSLGRSPAAATGSVSDRPVVYETVTVQAGQSLWGIARSAAPDADPRSTIARIVDLNDLPADGRVRAGQQITVPVHP